MAKVNFRQQKRQKELARKERQLERLSRRGERPSDEPAAPVPGPDPKVPEGTAGAGLPVELNPERPT